MLGVLPHRLVTGCYTLIGEEAAKRFLSPMEVMSLEDMLNRQFHTDAHFTSYQLVGSQQWPRLNKPVLHEIRADGGDIVLAYMAFDWDTPGHADWDEEQTKFFEGYIINCQHPILSQWSAIYKSKHGARLIYTLSKPIPVDEGEQCLSWMFKEFSDTGLKGVDPQCKDWTRLMRCPQVMRDSKPTWQEGYYELVYREGFEVDVNKVGRRSVKAMPVKHPVQPITQERPEYSDLQNYLWKMNKDTGKQVQTEFQKKTKKILKDSPYFDLLFNEGIAEWPKGTRNEQICRMLGIIVPILLEKARASVVQIFALAINPLLTLEQDQDWLEHGWNALKDIYSREVVKLNVLEEEKAAKVEKEMGLLDKMALGMKDWCQAPELHSDNDEVVRDFVRSNCIALTRSASFFLNKDGYYDDMPVVRDSVIARIRKTFLKEFICTTNMNARNELVDVTPTSIFNSYGSPVNSIIMKPVGGRGGYIEDMNGEKPNLILSTFCRNDEIEPVKNDYVEEWLYCLFGPEHFDTGCQWIGNALAFEEGLICALSLAGASNAGKKLLAHGLAECLKEPHIATPADLSHQSSAFLKTPFLVVDESWPKTPGGMPPADKFKSLTGGDGIVVNEKFMPQMQVLCPIRIILTANDEGILKTLTSGKSMGVDNKKAIGERIYHVRVSKKASAYLERIGGRSHTARPGHRWIRPDSGSEKSDFVLAKHFMYLYHNRNQIAASPRFLVMGNQGQDPDGDSLSTVEKLLVNNNHTPIVSKAIIKMVEDGNSHYAPYRRVNKTLTVLKVAREGVFKYVRTALGEKLSEGQVFEGMLPLLTTEEPEELDYKYWYDIDIPTLSKVATEQGMAVSKIHAMYKAQLDAKRRD